MANVMTYNGETIINLNLKNVSTEAVYAPGGVQKPYNRTTLQFEGTVGRATSPGNAGEFTLNTDQIRRNLMTPRADLLITLGGATLYNITAPDDANGPTPRDVSLTAITGTSYALVSGTIEVTESEGDYTGESANDITSNIVSHNYSVTHSTDDLFLTTRNVTGRIVIRQGVQSTPDSINPLSTNRKDNPDLLRGLVTPKLPQGFKREAATFVVSDDGLMLDYDIRDVEVPIVPPNPALRATGTLAFSMQNRFEWFTTVQVELEGPKKYSKAQLFLQAMAIALSKVNAKADGSIIQSADTVSALYSNKIAVRIVSKSIKINALNNVYPTTGFARTFDAMLGSTSGRAEDVGPYGTATIRAAKQRFFDPLVSDMTQAENETDIVYQGFKDGTGNVSRGPDISIFQMPNGTVDTSPSDDSVIDSSKLGNERNQDYTIYQETITTRSVNGVVTLPGTDPEARAQNYQRHAPYIIVTQQGRATRNRLTPDVPAPLTGEIGEVQSSTVINHSPEVFPDGSGFIYSTSWIFEIQLPVSSSRFIESSSGVVYINTVDNPTVIPLNAIALPSSETEMPYDSFDKSNA